LDLLENVAHKVNRDQLENKVLLDDLVLVVYLDQQVQLVK